MLDPNAAILSESNHESTALAVRIGIHSPNFRNFLGFLVYH